MIKVDAGGRMILREQEGLLHTMIDRLVNVYRPRAIYLFGSQAWGNPGETSDVDLYVVVESSKATKAERIRLGLSALLDLNIPVDLLVVTLDELEERKNHPSTLAHKILNKGIRLYEAA
jgi:predicted nucleotidyltransferase